MHPEVIISLVARPGERSVLRQDPDLPTLGDRSVFTHDLFVEGELIGFDGGTTTVVRIEGGVPHILCCVSMNLPDGTLAFQTFMKEQFPPPPFWTAVVGGTGAYRDVTGEMHIDPASPETHYYRLELRGITRFPHAAVPAGLTALER